MQRPVFEPRTFREADLSDIRLIFKTTWPDQDDHHPSEAFELTASTLQAHMKPHSKLILKPLIYLTAHLHDELTL